MTKWARVSGMVLTGARAPLCPVQTRMISWRQWGSIHTRDMIADGEADGAGARTGIAGEIVPVAGIETKIESTGTGGIAMSALIATGATDIGRDPAREITIAKEDGHARGLGTGTGKTKITGGEKTANIRIHAIGTQTLTIGAKSSPLFRSIFTSWVLGVYGERIAYRYSNILMLYTKVYLSVDILLFIYSSSCPVCLLAGRSGIDIIFTTILVQPVKCCVRCPWPVSGLYCSQANPVSFHSLKTFSTTFFRRLEYSSRACSW